MEPVFEFPLSLDKHGPQTLARRLHQQLRAAIVEQRLAAGTPLPSTRRVAQSYGVARNTVIAAYDLLMAEGFIVTRPGAAAEVADLAQWRQMAPRTRTRTRPAPPPAIDWRKAQSSEKPIGSAATAASARGFHLGLPDHRWFATDVWRRL